MSTTPKRRPSTLSASKFVASQMPLGATPDPRANARPEPAPMTGAGRSSANANANTKAPGNAPKVTWGSVHGRSPDNRNSPLLQGASAFSMPGTVAFKEVMRKSAATNAAAAASASAAAAAAKAASVKKAPSKKAPAARARTAAPSGARNRQDSIVVTSLIVAFLLIAVSVASVQVSGGMSTERSKTAISSTLSVVHEQQTAFRTLNQRFATWSELSNSGMTLGPRQAVVSSNATASHWFMAVRDSSTGVVCSRTGELFDTGPDERRAACSESTL